MSNTQEYEKIKQTWQLKHRPVKIVYNDGKKQVYQNVPLNNHNAFELVNDGTFIFLDIDATDRDNQRAILDPYEDAIYKFVTTNDSQCLIERSLNGGYHLCFKISEQQLGAYRSFEINVTANIKWEFKNSFISFPTPTVTQLYMPDDPRTITKSALAIFLCALFGIFDGTDFSTVTDAIDTCYGGSRKRTISQVSVEVDDTVESDEEDVKETDTSYHTQVWLPKIAKGISQDLTDFYKQHPPTYELNRKNVILAAVHRIEELFQQLKPMFANRKLHFVDLEMFIIWLCDSDKTEDGMFAKLSDTKRWREWTLSYAKLCNSIRLTHRGARGGNIEGSLSRHLCWTDPFPCYRIVTRKNLVGAQLTDAQARAEFDALCDNANVRNGFGEFGTSTLFVRFLELTFLALTYNDPAMAALDQICIEFNPKRSPVWELVVKDFLDHRFSSNEVRIASLTGDSNKGDDKDCAYIYMRGLPWVPVSSPEFKLFIGQLYPNCKDVNKLPEPFARRATKNPNLHKWINIIPYNNGLLDFGGNPNSPVVFRNYKETDTVTLPIPQDFNIQQYMNLGGEDRILLLDNTARYGGAFCWFMCGLFGVNDYQNPTLNLFQFSRLLGVCILVASGLLRTKKFQKCLILNGLANNGKSTFINMICKAFQGKCEPVVSHQLFSRETFSHADPNEKFVVYDNEVSQFYLDRFKNYIADFDAPITTRIIYKKPVPGSVFNAFYIGACNSPIVGLKATTTLGGGKAKDDIFEYDYGFHRRVYMETLYNLFTKVDEKMAYDIFEPNTEKLIANGLAIYLFDVLRVFNINNLGTSCNHIQTSPYQTRLFGTTNNPLINKLHSSYLSVNTLDLDTINARDRTNIIDTIRPVSIRELIQEITKSQVDFIPPAIITLLETFYYKLSPDAQYLLDLVSIADLSTIPGLSRRHIEKLKLPHAPTKIREGESDQDFVKRVIPPDHRIQLSEQLQTTFYTIIVNSARQNPVSVNIRPICLEKQYKHATIETLFDLPTFLSQ